MGIMDLFSGKSGRKAAMAQMQALQAAQGQATGAIDTGLAEGLKYLTGPGGATQALQGGYGQALDALKQFYPEAQGFAGKATAAYDPMIATGRTGVDAYTAAMGLGPAGSAGTEAFRNTPGYQFQMDQGLDAVNRTANARGLLGSGNTTTDLLKYSQGLADQTYGSYLSRLSPLMQMYGQGIAGQAGGLTNQANLANTQGAARATLGTGLGSGMAGIYGQAGQMPLAAAGQKAGIIGNMGSQYAQTLGQGMMAGQQAMGNQMNAIMGGLNLVSKLAGGFM
jgi:phage gp37-like protein